ncbi:MAG: DegV family protein [Chloroflexi bacterium]|nr:DegV family protein [Chloroflexota bacterium]
MSRIAIITDTDSSLPADLAAAYGIRQVPISVQFGDETLDAAFEIDDATLFARIDKENKLPATAAPSPGRFEQAYREAIAEGAEAIVCFCVSSEVSGTYNAALLAREMVSECPITVVDSRRLSMGQGYMALAAAEAAQRGASVEEVIAYAEDVGSRSHLFAALATLKYLAMSGRVGHLAAGMASLLNIKPILTMRDGKLELLERARTTRRAWARVIELTREVVGAKCPERMAVLHVAARDDALAFAQQLRQAMPCPDDITICELTPGLSVHSGAGMVGVTVITAPQ